MKKILSFALAVILLFGILPMQARATTDLPDNIIMLDNGTYIEITIEESPTRAVNSKSGYKTYTCKNDDGDILWKAKLSAVFNYDGSTSTACYGSCTVTISNSNWYEISNTTSCSGNTATTNLKMGKKVLGITISKPEYTITLSCDKNGKLS